MHRTWKIRLLFFLLLWAVLPLQGQVNICYDFESATPNTRPLGWGALPNLDFHYVGVNSDVAHTGSNSLHNNGTTCFTIMPDEGINYSADNVWLTFWYNLHNNTDYFDVGYLTDATDSTTFHLLATVHEWSQEWHFFAVDLSSVPTGARIAFFGHDLFSADGTFWIDDISLTSTPCAAWGLHVAENCVDSARLEWLSAGSPTVTLTINGTPLNVTGNSYTFARNPNSSYTVSLIAQCPVTGCIPIQPFSETTIYRYRESSCLDATDFNSSMAIPYHGTYIDPYLHTGTYTTNAPGVTGIFAGSHTVNTNPGSDGGGMMVFPRTIPPGDASTLRLGNRLGDWESDAVLYTLAVDTNESDLLVIKYTVAMAFGSFQGTEVAHRSDTLHPAWFRIELLDDTLGQLLPEACNRFYIDMWDNAGWDEVNSMYKRRNFTGMAFDLAPYHGQQLHLRVTATDGVVNNRWCYGYYNFECLKHTDYSYDCSGDSITFAMPYGFLYRWFRDGETATLSTSQSITVPADSTLYHCELIDRFNPACNTLVSRWALPQPQQWVTETVVENALPHTFMGTTFFAETDTTFVLPSATGCDTLLHYHLLVWPNQVVRLEHFVCPDGWPLSWEGHTFPAPDSVTFTLTDSHGADSTVTLVALQAPDYEVFDTLVICPGNPFVYDDVDYGGPATVDLPLSSQHGCDSLVHLSLVPRAPDFRPSAYYSDDGRLWTDTLPIILCSGQTLHLCDSTPQATHWTWSLAGYHASGRHTTIPLDTTLQGDTLMLQVTNSGCIDTLLWSVFVLPSPTADFSWTPEVPVDIAPEVRFVNLTTPADCDYRWQIHNGNSVDTLTGFAPSYRWPGDLPQGNFDVSLLAAKDTTFSLLIDTVAPKHQTIRTFRHTCVDSITHTVEIVTAWLQFPNLVSPNGDGINDTWRILNLLELGQYPMNELWIYNKWGTLIHHVRDISQESDFWDPALTHSPDGTYFFRFSAHGLFGLIRCNGSIEVIR